MSGVNAVSQNQRLENRAESQLSDVSVKLRGEVRPRLIDLARKWPDSHFVYVIEDRDHGAVKIGIAADPYQRATDLQVGNPCQLWVHQCFEVINAARARDIEVKAHKALARQRLTGEWFNVCAQTACDAIRRAAGHSTPCMAKIDTASDVVA